MAQTARVTLTLSNIATEEDIRNLEETMSALSDAIAALRATVENFTAATRPERVAELEAALQAERDAAAALAASEAAEDVEQDATLQEARQATDALMAEMTGAATELEGITAQLAAVGTAVEETDDTTPVGEVEVPEPAPAPEPVPAPADDTAPAEDTAPGEDVPTEDAPTEPAPGPAPAPAPGGPTDADGNPVDGPRV